MGNEETNVLPLTIYQPQFCMPDAFFAKFPSALAVTKTNSVQRLVRLDIISCLHGKMLYHIQQRGYGLRSP